jgi:pyridoxal phosphate enzyme (YggS family)
VDEGAATVEERLAGVRRRIAEACARAGRDPAEITLVAVSKRQPAAKVRQAFEHGQLVFGENQVQEATAKAADLPVDIRWHLIGPLQSNKVKPVVRLFDAVHSVDRPKIARLLDQEAGRIGRRLDVFCQIHLGGEESKHGFPVEVLEAEVRPLVGLPNLRVQGLMAIPPFEEDPGDARRWFRQLRELRDATRRWPEWHEVPGFLSMGMSHDFEVAIEEGATHVRVGTDLFGPRPS